MSLHPPNAQDVPTRPKMARSFSTYFVELAKAVGGVTGVVSGCAVTAAVSPDMSVNVASGRVVVGLAPVNVSGGSVGIPAAHATLDRWDAIVANAAGSVGVHSGTAATSPVPPTISSAEVALALVFVPATDTAITDDQLVDLIVPVPEPLTASPIQTVKATSDLAINNNATLAADPLLKFTMTSGGKYAIRAMIVVSLPASGGGIKLGIDGPNSPAPTFISIGGWYVRETVASSPLVIPTTGAFGPLSQAAFGGSGQLIFHLEGVVQNSTDTTPDFAITIAQNSAVALDSIRRAGSFLEHSGG